jgi:hypothetical protein
MGCDETASVADQLDIRATSGTFYGVVHGITIL